jgi:hypothetical protein
VRAAQHDTNTDVILLTGLTSDRLGTRLEGGHPWRHQSDVSAAVVRSGVIAQSLISLGLLLPALRQRAPSFFMVNFALSPRKFARA